MKNCLTLVAAAAILSCADAAHADRGESKVRHVLMVSVDGMHEQDLARCLRDRTCPHIAELAEHGVTYTDAHTPGRRTRCRVLRRWSRAAGRSRRACSTTMSTTARCIRLGHDCFEQAGHRGLPAGTGRHRQLQRAGPLLQPGRRG